MTRTRALTVPIIAGLLALLIACALVATSQVNAAPSPASPYQSHAEHCRSKGLAPTCTLTNIQEQCTTNGCMVAEAFIWARTVPAPAPTPARTARPGKTTTTTTTSPGGSTPPSTTTSPSPAAPSPSGTSTTPSTTSTTPATPAAPAGIVDNTDLLKGAGAVSQCNGFRGKALENCKRTGSPATGYPISAYQFDITIDVGTFDLRNSFHYAFQWMILIVWMLLLMGVRLVLVILDWGFTLSVLTSIKGGIGQTLGNLHARILTPWLPVALAVLALWGIWRGMVQRKAGETLAGVALSLAAVVAVGAMLVNPQGTVLKATKVADDAGFALYGAFNGGKFSANGGRAAFGESQRNLWTNTVDPVWCLMQFGSTEFCARTKYPEPPKSALKPDGCPDASGGRTKLWGFVPTFGKAVYAEDLKAYCENAKLSPATMKDLWLLHQGNGKAREDLAKAWRNKPDTAQAMNQLSEDGTLHRGVLILVLGAGLIGAILFFGIIAARIIQASLLLFILILFAPMMALVACAGDSGRKTFLAWSRRLIGAALAKFLWAGVLGVATLAAGLISSANNGSSSSWFFTAFLNAALWWTLFLRRDQIMGWMGTDDQDHHSGAVQALQGAFYAQRLASSALTATGVAPGARALRSGASRLRTMQGERREQRSLDNAQFAMHESVQRSRELDADTTDKKNRIGEIDQRTEQLRNTPVAANERQALADKQHEIAQLREAPVASAEQHRIHEIDQQLAAGSAMSAEAAGRAHDRVANDRTIAGLEDSRAQASHRKGGARENQRALDAARNKTALLGHADVTSQQQGSEHAADLKAERAQLQDSVTSQREARAEQLMGLRGEAHALEGKISAAESARSSELKGLASERAGLSEEVSTPDRQIAHAQVVTADSNVAMFGREFSNAEVERVADVFADADTGNRHPLQVADAMALGISRGQFDAADRATQDEWLKEADAKRRAHHVNLPKMVTPSAKRRASREAAVRRHR